MEESPDLAQAEFEMLAARRWRWTLASVGMLGAFLMAVLVGWTVGSEAPVRVAVVLLMAFIAWGTVREARFARAKARDPETPDHARGQWRSMSWLGLNVTFAAVLAGAISLVAIIAGF